MDEPESLSHSKWECKYHVVFIPKCRRKTLYEQLRRHLGEVFRKLAEQKESRILEGHLMPDHVQMLIAIPPKFAVSQVIGYIKGKSAITLAREYGDRKRNFVGQHFWARGYFVSTVGRDEATIRTYIRNQEQEDQRLDQLDLWRWSATSRWPKNRGAALATPHSRFEMMVASCDGAAGSVLIDPEHGTGRGHSQGSLIWSGGGVQCSAIRWQPRGRRGRRRGLDATGPPG